MAMHFDGAGDYIDIPHYSDLNLTDDITLSAWICTDDSASHDWQMIFTKEPFSYYIMLNYNKLVGGFMSSGATWNESFSSDGIYDDIWYHVCVTFEKVADSNMYISTYIDGINVSNNNRYNNIITSSEYMSIGSDSYSEHFHGQIEDVRIYNRLLSDEEIKTIHACKGTDGIYNGIVGRCLLNEGASNTSATGSNSIINLYHNGNHGTPYYSPTYKPSILKHRRVA